MVTKEDLPCCEIAGLSGCYFRSDSFLNNSTMVPGSCKYCGFNPAVKEERDKRIKAGDMVTENGIRRLIVPRKEGVADA